VADQPPGSPPGLAGLPGGAAAEPPAAAPAYYARRGGRLADWWTLLHPPYTIWHLSYVLIGAALAPRVDWVALGATVLAFFLAVGLSAHVLDELNGRPLGTGIPATTLWAVAIGSLGGAVLLGVWGISRSGPVLVPFILAGVLLVFGYNLELFGGRLHTDVGFAVAWGGFPVAVGFVAQAPGWGAPAASAAAGCAAATTLSYAQRRLSMPAKRLRRRAHSVTGEITYRDGTTVAVDRATLLAPIEGALHALSLTVPLLAVALLALHVG
jgi:hypothetical protein